MIRFLVNIPVELHRMLKKEAIAYGQTLNGLIRQILWDWAERQSKEADKHSP
jgi:predicted HicB family RNase H-like nuclease